MQVIFIKDRLYDVQSASDPERTYVVNLADGGTCSCPNHQYRAVQCKHIQAVREHLASQPQPTALAKAAAKAAELTDEELLHWAKAKGEGPEAGACWLELARRRNAQNYPAPEGQWDRTEWLWRGQPVWQSLGSGVWAIWTAEGQWHSLSSETLEACPPVRASPRPIPAGVEILLEGATEAERERALAIYR